MNRFQRVLTTGLALAIAAACTDVPTAIPDHPGPDLGKGKPPSGTPVSVVIVSTSPGLLPDGPTAYTTTASADGSVDIRPACGSRSLDLQGMGLAFDALGDRSTCNGNRGAGYMFLKFPGIMNAGTGACPDLDAPEPTINALNFGVNSRYFFQVNTDNDGRYDDTMYTLVITDCAVVVSGNSRHVTASVGDLWEGQNGSAPLMSGIAINVDLTITQ